MSPVAITDAFVHRVGQRTYHYLRHHGDEITVRNASLEAEAASIRAADHVTDAIDRLMQTQRLRDERRAA